MPAYFAMAAAIMFLTGLGIPVMAALNGGLGRALASPVAATVVLFAVGLVLALGALAVMGMPDATRWRAAPLRNFGGAAFIVGYIIAITYFGPRIGVGNAVFFVLLGQLVAAAAIDHFGLLGATRVPLTAQRLAGIAVMTAGVWLAKRTSD